MSEPDRVRLFCLLSDLRVHPYVRSFVRSFIHKLMNQITHVPSIIVAITIIRRIVHVSRPRRVVRSV